MYFFCLFSYLYSTYFENCILRNIIRLRRCVLNKNIVEKEQTYYIHEGEHVILHMLLAVEAHDGVVHSQQHLDVVVVFLRVPPLALGLGQFVFDEVQSRGEAGDPEVCHCKKYEQHVNKFWIVGMGCFFLSYLSDIKYSTLTLKCLMMKLVGVLIGL